MFRILSHFNLFADLLSTHMGISTTQRKDGAAVNITLNITLSDFVVVDGKMTVAKEEEKDVINPERSLFNSALLVLAVTLAMVVNVRVVFFFRYSFFVVVDVNCLIYTQSANSTAFSMALPTIQKELHVDEARLQWIVCAFPLSSVSCHRIRPNKRQVFR